MAKQSTRRRSRQSLSADTVQVNTTGGAVRITQPSTGRGKKSATQKAAVVVDVVAPTRAAAGFVGFLREHTVVGLAVGLVIGTQLKAIVDALNSGFINPLIGLFFQGGTLRQQAVDVSWRGREATLEWGAVVYQIVDFIFVMLVIYMIIKFFKLDKLDKPKNK